jgi:hypothetical protein
MAAKLRHVVISARLRHLALTSQHPKKSAPSAWPGKTSPHNRESRERIGPGGFMTFQLARRTRILMLVRPV